MTRAAELAMAMPKVLVKLACVERARALRTYTHRVCLLRWIGSVSNANCLTFTERGGTGRNVTRRTAQG